MWSHMLNFRKPSTEFSNFSGQKHEALSKWSGKKKKFKRKLEIAESQKNALHKFLDATSSVPLSFTSDNPQCTLTSNIFPEISTSEVRPIIPPDSEQNKGDDNEKKRTMKKLEAIMESNCDKKSEEDKDRPERIIDLDVEMLNDIALWPTTLTDLMIDYIIRKKPNNISNIETLKSVYKDRDQVYYRGLTYDHFYWKKINEVKEDFPKQAKLFTAILVNCFLCDII
ncbi:uncharacterized protein TNCT_323071 [Trichonephila clavata]|uniref:Uncharacterized protein n=1 Tax=Trichonephila clavata TaxID=2740835 RepID=A0A8X6KZR0_TRICU|nr:uncharacterized protein TNCT_323071 [Trichonephila clavata]